MTGPSAPDRGYLLCSEHRTGSTLLCQWLAATGTLGRPDEYFTTTESAVALERDPARLAGVLARAATPNGIWGIKLFSQQFDQTEGARWIAALPDARFVHLRRHDLLGQAISLARAIQTGRYLSHESERAVPRYDARAIHRHLARLAEAEARWRLWFARTGVEPLWLVYEEMLADPAATLAAVAAQVGVAAPAIDPARVAVAIQRDAVSAEWRARFVAERGDPTHLDHPLGRWRVRARRLARDVGVRLRGVRG